MTKKDKTTEKLKTRPPIVVVLGHVDHGKTTLLDYIRKTSVAAKESGGITQHIGAYQVEVPQEPKSRESEASRGIPRQARDDFAASSHKITFIDTPGHEAFSQMRSRGAKVADVAILIIAAEEGIKPQTKEVISHIKEYKIPVVVAFNKIDKPGANAAKVAGELAKEGIVVESQGGQVPSVNISAKNGQGVDELLEVLLLVAEMEELKADFDKSGSGVVIESYLDSQRGPTTTLLVREGTLKKDDIVVCGGSYGRVRILEDFQKNPIKKASPSTPAVIVGLNEVPTVGERFSVVESEEAAREKANKQSKKPAQKPKSIEVGPPESEDFGGKTLNIILKADVRGSLEAIEETLNNVNQEEVKINILKSEVGNVSESDIKLAYSSDAAVIGFRIKVPAPVSNLANRQEIRIKIFDVIYELIEEVKKGLTKLLAPEVVKEDLGKLKVIAIFRKEKSKMIIGGKVISGRVENHAQINVIRGEKKIGEGRISQLQHNKKNVPEVEKGKEAGILFEGEPIIEEGDTLEIYKKEKRKREL